MPVEGEEGRGYKQEENDPRRDSEEQQVWDFVMYVHMYVLGIAQEWMCV